MAGKPLIVVHYCNGVLESVNSTGDCNVVVVEYDKYSDGASPVSKREWNFEKDSVEQVARVYEEASGKTLSQRLRQQAELFNSTK